MDFLKSWIKVDVPEITKKKTTSTQKLPLTIELDYCNRFRPLFDKNTFQEDISNTDGELI